MLRYLKNAQFRSSSRKARILTTGIHLVFRGLKFEPDAEIERKGVFCKGLMLSIAAVVGIIPQKRKNYKKMSVSGYLTLQNRD
jgi:hypothetical protein